MPVSVCRSTPHCGTYPIVDRDKKDLWPKDSNNVALFQTKPSFYVCILKLHLNLQHEALKFPCLLQMPSVKDESDAEGDEMSHVSNDSNATSSSSESSEEHSDSDESSEMDEDECEKRRTDCVDNIVDLERQFCLLRERYVEVACTTIH